MNEERINTLIDSLSTLVCSFNAALDRLDTITDMIEGLSVTHEELIDKNIEAFKYAREDFLRRIIEVEVNKEIENNKQRRRKVG